MPKEGYYGMPCFNKGSHAYCCSGNRKILLTPQKYKMLKTFMVAKFGQPLPKSVLLRQYQYCMLSGKDLLHKIFFTKRGIK